MKRSPASESPASAQTIAQAVEHLCAHGYPDASVRTVGAILDRYPFLARHANGWQELARIYVEHPEWR